MSAADAALQSAFTLQTLPPASQFAVLCCDLIESFPSVLPVPVQRRLMSAVLIAIGQWTKDRKKFLQELQQLQSELQQMQD